jgi:hypothetical protein
MSKPPYPTALPFLLKNKPLFLVFLQTKMDSLAKFNILPSDSRT